MSPGASIIVVAFNSGETIVRCMQSVIITLRDCDELFVVDNASTDDTVARIESACPAGDARIHICLQTENLGFSQACNLAIERSRKTHVVLLNPDTEIFGDWIPRLLNHFKEYPRTGAVGALTNSGMSNQNILRYFPDYFDYLANASDLIETLQKKFDKKSVPTKLLMGFCMALRRDLLDRYGALDTDIFLGDDDLEMSWRLRKNGYHLRVALDVFLNHERHVSFNSLPETETRNLVQQGTDVLYNKMLEYYKPRRVPDPRLYFGIDWWHPSALKGKTYEEVFEFDILPCSGEGVTAAVRRMLKAGKLAQAADILDQALAILQGSYPLWYLAGSVYFLQEEFEKAEFALKNAWCFEVEKTKARDKLLKLYDMQGRQDEALRLFGALPA